MDILELAKAALALFAIVDPVGVIPMFLLATQGYTLAHRVTPQRELPH